MRSSDDHRIRRITTQDTTQEGKNAYTQGGISLTTSAAPVMKTNTAHSRRRSPRTRQPHYRQAHTWARFAHILREVRPDAYQRKEEALAWSLAKKTRGFAIPVTLTLEEGFGFGWSCLDQVLAHIRYPELEANLSYNAQTDRDDVLLFVHYTTREGTRKAPIGRLSRFEAEWMAPILRDDLDRWMNIFVVKKEGRTCDVAISSSWVAAHYWIDGYDDRKASVLDRRRSESEKAVATYVTTSAKNQASPEIRREIAALQKRIEEVLIEINAREELGQPTERLTAYIESLAGQIDFLTFQARRQEANRVEEPSVEDWLREDVGLREVPFSDLEGRAYWALQYLE